MTPLEINKKIASMKNHDGIDDAHPYSNKNNRIYNWAENIGDAFELFEEMVKNRDHENVSLYLGNVYDEWVCGEGDFEEVNGELAKTATIAICLTWIKWKETK